MVWALAGKNSDYEKKFKALFGINIKILRNQ